MRECRNSPLIPSSSYFLELRKKTKTSSWTRVAEVHKHEFEEDGFDEEIGQNRQTCKICNLVSYYEALGF